MRARRVVLSGGHHDAIHLLTGYDRHWIQVSAQKVRDSLRK
jgi:hypothetical protein